mmetsp:Transcript_33262/g.40897  ORF Transcript_33262/g.40897 Transcript_33262/m.40897 type:complete len:291 (+) Transcript_33262:18-890(+)
MEPEGFCSEISMCNACEYRFNQFHNARKTLGNMDSYDDNIINQHKFELCYPCQMKMSVQLQLTNKKHQEWQSYVEKKKTHNYPTESYQSPCKMRNYIPPSGLKFNRFSPTYTTSSNTTCTTAFTPNNRFRKNNNIDRNKSATHRYTLENVPHRNAQKLTNYTNKYRMNTMNRMNYSIKNTPKFSYPSSSNSQRYTRTNNSMHNSFTNTPTSNIETDNTPYYTLGTPNYSTTNSPNFGIQNSVHNTPMTPNRSMETVNIAISMLYDGIVGAFKKISNLLCSKLFPDDDTLS